jgi:hypothetical protein
MWKAGRRAGIMRMVGGVVAVQMARHALAVPAIVV